MLPTQETHDPTDPRQHFAWALRNLPMIAGVGAITNPKYLADWSEHLVRAGCVHRDYLVSLADENGNIHISQLPEQTIKWQQPFRGPRSSYNPAARWVSSDAPPVEVVRIPDINKLTQQENEYVLQQYRDAGMIPDNSPGPPLGGVE